MSQIPSANDVLMGGGGAPTAKFVNPGDTIGGRIVSEPRAYQEREYDPRNPGNGAAKFYPKSGDPIMAVNVDVQTTLRDPMDPEDTGIRRIYIEGKRLKDAVRDAIRAVGGSGLEVGGELHVTFTGLGQAEAGMNAPKLYAARYVLAASSVLMNEPGAPQTQQGWQAPPQAAPPAFAQPGYAPPAFAQPGYAPPVAAAQYAAPAPAPALAPAAAPDPAQDPAFAAYQAYLASQQAQPQNA